MSLAENVSARVVYKAYATGVITSNSQPVSTVDPANTGGQILRRTTATLNLTKDTYESAEVNGHRQVSDFRHGVKRASGSVNGELSPGTYWDLIEAATRGTEASAVTATITDFTSVAADNATSKFTFAAGNPHTKGYRVGDVIRFTSLSDADNNSKNFVILAMGGTQNRELTVYPAPDDMTADTSFTMTSVGKSVYIPESSHVSRKFAFEVYNTESGVDTYRMFTECRIGGFNLSLPSTGMSTIEIPVMGRDMETASGGSAPFFGSPTAATSTGLLAAVNGLVRVGGVNVGVVTGASVNYQMEMTGPAVVGQNFVPEIFLGRSRVSGSLTAFFEDLTMVNYFKNETEVEVLLYLTASSSATADAMTVYMPRVKFGGADVSMDGEAGMSVTMPFTALKYATAGAGIEATTLRITDTAAS
jgi:hypothetical protein